LIERAHFPAQIYHITQGCAVSPTGSCRMPTSKRSTRR
jgi:hypothetical protein